MKTMIAAILAVLTLSAPVFAETQSERDARRASYVAGFSCYITSNGQSVRVIYNADGTGDAYHQEAPIYFTWRVSEDKFCMRVESNSENCSDLPPVDTGNEREKFLAMLGKNCT